jgi:hypothetical protein
VLAVEPEGVDLESESDSESVFHLRHRGHAPRPTASDPFVGIRFWPAATCHSKRCFLHSAQCDHLPGLEPNMRI